jgi:hypothetical protein
MVPDRWEKRLAEDLTEGVFGVAEVHNRLRTSSGAPAQPERGVSVNNTRSTSIPGQTDGAETPRPMPTSTGASGWPSS